VQPARIAFGWVPTAAHTGVSLCAPRPGDLASVLYADCSRRSGVVRLQGFRTGRLLAATSSWSPRTAPPAKDLPGVDDSVVSPAGVQGRAGVARGGHSGMGGWVAGE
jgi:hypothetical protein